MPLSRCSLTRAPCSSSTTSNLLTLSFSRSVARFSRRWSHSVSAISASTNGSNRSVSHQLMAGDVELVMDHPVGPGQQILNGDVLLHRVGRAIKFPRAIAGQLEDCFAQGFRGDRAEIDAAPAEHGFSLDDRDPLVELGALDGGPLSGWPRADDQEIVIECVLGHALPFTRARWPSKNVPNVQRAGDNLVTARRSAGYRCEPG